MKKLILKDKEWARGKGTSLLELSDGTRCCLGIALHEAGVENLLGRATPLFLGTPMPPGWKWLVSKWGNSDDAFSLMQINDDNNISDAQRLQEMKPIFAAHDIEVIYEKTN